MYQYRHSARLTLVIGIIALLTTGCAKGVAVESVDPTPGTCSDSRLEQIRQTFHRRGFQAACNGGGLLRARVRGVTVRADLHEDGRVVHLQTLVPFRSSSSPRQRVALVQRLNATVEGIEFTAHGDHIDADNYVPWRRLSTSDIGGYGNMFVLAVHMVVRASDDEQIAAL